MSQSGNSFQMNRSSNGNNEASATAGERLRDREKQRQARAQLAVEPEEFMPLFGAPVKVLPPAHDMTRQLIEETLGSYDRLKNSIVDDQKGLIGVWQQPQTPLPSKQHHDPEEEEPKSKPEFAAPKKPSYRTLLPPRFPNSNSGSTARPAPPTHARGGENPSNANSSANQQRSKPAANSSSSSVSSSASTSTMPSHVSGGNFPGGRDKEAGTNGSSAMTGPLGHPQYGDRNIGGAPQSKKNSLNGASHPKLHLPKGRMGGAYSIHSGEDVELILKKMQMSELLSEITATPRNEPDTSRFDLPKMLSPVRLVALPDTRLPPHSLKRLESWQKDLSISDSEDDNSDVDLDVLAQSDVPRLRSPLLRSPIASPISPLAPETPCPPSRKSVSPAYAASKRLSTSSDEGENSDGSSSNSPSASGTDSSSDEEPEFENKDPEPPPQPPQHRPASPPASVNPSWRLDNFLQPPNPPLVDLNPSLSFDEPPSKSVVNQGDSEGEEELPPSVPPRLAEELHDALGHILLPPLLSEFSDSDDSSCGRAQPKIPTPSRSVRQATVEKSPLPPRPDSVTSTHSASSLQRRSVKSPAVARSGKKVPSLCDPPPVAETTAKLPPPKKKRGRPPKIAAKVPVTSTPVRSPIAVKRPPVKALSKATVSSDSSSSASSSSSSSSSDDEAANSGSDVDVTGTPSPGKARLVTATPPSRVTRPRPPPFSASNSPADSDLSSSDHETRPVSAAPVKKSPPKVDHGGKSVQDNMKKKAIMRLIVRDRSSNSVSSSSDKNKDAFSSSESPVRAPSMAKNANETLDRTDTTTDGAKPTVMCRLRLNLLLRRPEKKALNDVRQVAEGTLCEQTESREGKSEAGSDKKKQRRLSTSSVSSANSRRSKHHYARDKGGEKENREQKGVGPEGSNPSSESRSRSSSSNGKRSLPDLKTPETKERRKRKASEAEAGPNVGGPSKKPALILVSGTGLDEKEKEKEKEPKDKDSNKGVPPKTSREPKRRKNELKVVASEPSSPALSLFTNHERNGDVSEGQKAELMNGHGGSGGGKVKPEGAGPDSKIPVSEGMQECKNSGWGGTGDDAAALPPIVPAAVPASTRAIYLSYFETPPVLGSDDIDMDARDQNQYLVEAKKLKHAADRQTNRTLQVKQYLEAVLYFILTGIAMEHDAAMEKSAYILYKDTLGLIKTISSSQKALQQVDSKLVVLSLRCQSLLYLKLYRMRHLEAKELQRIINDYQKKITDDVKREQPGGIQPYANLPVPVASTGALNTIGLFRSTGTPSPLSPTPSPAGSVGSVGSQSSGYSSGELPGAVNPSASSSAGLASVGGATATAVVPPTTNPGGGIKMDTVVSNGALTGYVSVPVAVHNILLKQNQYSVYLNSSHDLWEQGDLLVQQAELQVFFIELDRVCGPLTLHSSLRDLVRYARQGLQRLRYSGGNSR